MLQLACAVHAPDMREHLTCAHAVVIGGLFNDRSLACSAVDRCQTCSIRAIGRYSYVAVVPPSAFFTNDSIDCPFDYRATSIRSLAGDCTAACFKRFPFVETWEGGRALPCYRPNNFLQCTFPYDGGLYYRQKKEPPYGWGSGNEESPLRSRSRWGHEATLWDTP